MAAEEEKTQRQRFYIELKPGETTITSWKKLLREARKKDPCGPHSTSLETPRRALDGDSDGGQYDESIVKKKRVKHVNRATSSGYMKPIKRRVEMRKIEGDKTDHDHSSIKDARPENLSAKATVKASNLFDETVGCSSSPAMVKDHQPEELQTFTQDDAPVLTYTKKSATCCNKFKYPPLKAIEDASVFPLKTANIVLQKTQKITSEKNSEIKEVGHGGDSSDVMHQNFKGRNVPAKSNPKSGILFHDKVSPKGWHSDKRSRSCELDAISPGYNSSLKDSLAELWPKGVMVQHKLTEAINRAKNRRATAYKILGQNVVDEVKGNPDLIPCQKRKVNDLSDDFNPIFSLPRKTALKKATIKQPVLQSKSSRPLIKGFKLTSKQKQLVPEKTNVKVRFLLKQEHKSLQSNEQAAKDTLNHSRAAASLTCSQST